MPVLVRIRELQQLVDLRLAETRQDAMQREFGNRLREVPVRREVVADRRLHVEHVEHDRHNADGPLVDGGREPTRPPALRDAGDHEPLDAPFAPLGPHHDRGHGVHGAHRALGHGVEHGPLQAVSRQGPRPRPFCRLPIWPRVGRRAGLLPQDGFMYRHPWR